jgi:hypothetical protein
VLEELRDGEFFRRYVEINRPEIVDFSLMTYESPNSLGYCVYHKNKCASVGKIDQAFRSHRRQKNKEPAPQ